MYRGDQEEQPGGLGLHLLPACDACQVSTLHRLRLSYMCAHLNTSHLTQYHSCSTAQLCKPRQSPGAPPLQPQASGGRVGGSPPPPPRCVLPPSSTDPVDLFGLPSRLLSLLHCPSSSLLRSPSGFGALRAFAAWPVSPSETALLKASISTCLLVTGPSPAPPPHPRLTHQYYKELLPSLGWWFHLALN